MKWTLGLKGFRRTRSERSQEVSTPAAPPNSPTSTLSASTTRHRKPRPAPLPLTNHHLDVRLESGERMTSSEEMSMGGSEMMEKVRGSHLDEGYGSAMEQVEMRRTRGRRQGFGDGLGAPIEGVYFASPFEQQEQNHILSRSFSTRLPIRRPSSASPSSESDHSSKFSLSTPPTSRAPSPAITRSSTINTMSSSFRGRRSSSSTRSQLSYSPPSSPTTSALSLPRIITRLDEEGRRVLGSRRRRSLGPEPERVRRTKKTFGVGDDDDSNTSAEEEDRKRAGLARVRTSMPPLSAVYYEADDESMELLAPTETSTPAGRPPSRRNSSPAFHHSRRRSYTSSPLSPLTPQCTSSHTQSSTSPITPRSIVIIPLASTRRQNSLPCSATFTPLQHSFPISNIEESPTATPRPSSLRRPSTIAFADFPSTSPLPRSPIPPPALAKAKRRETMSVEPNFLFGRGLVEGICESRKSLEELAQSEWEERREWWGIGDERERGRGCLKVVNPDEGAGSTSTSRRPSVEIPHTNRSSYYSCSSELDDPLPIGLAF
ncbi:hypothetical protein BCR35DRAFT_353133 [Leucosporidium creatinivorum]|uniref:Uncharacterized protein n=1 Tax=Leucosporidium creatinivorum TaxID=106004 RepID=A0A1Y2F188_9BASI|nr:hypothetical protein BCR35DRAFT_353133 [Leucosporidium creatinivorum]